MPGLSFRGMGGLMKSNMHKRLLFGGALMSAGLAMGMPASADTFTVIFGYDAGPGTLRQAVLDANANPGPDVIEISVTSRNPSAVAMIVG